MRYDWVIVGGGIAGICLAEILTREGKQVVLIEKQGQLAGGTTKGFHEWIHTGSLYTLVPDRLQTLRFVIGAIDDLLEYYSSFENMNVRPTEVGLAIKPHPQGWFYDDNIVFQYRIRRLNLPWLTLVSRSIDIIDMIKRHDWLRRRGGVLERPGSGYFPGIVRRLAHLVLCNERYFELTTPDFTTNSRAMLADLLASAAANGLEIRLGTELERVVRVRNCNEVTTSRGIIHADKVVLCSGKNIKDFVKAQVKTSYAPIAVVSGIEDGARSFVRLDYMTSRCINLVLKSDGVGLVGGITLKHRSECAEYLDYVISEHRKMNPNLKVLGTYIGEKDEVTFKGQNRNYLYHIVESPDNIWSVVPGKYTLAFSVAPEFYRRIYKRNPSRNGKTRKDNGEYRSMIADTFWQELSGTSKTGRVLNGFDSDSPAIRRVL